ncbi:MAG: hypothetical protein A2583_07475 [Bdellovibrionales bacterium RIFOXYD1_FULL_53_11]|nr:MAG: hypothetical protein A2583_07475 [Bdellovibrionales bacterium RIFOXYD1_FULL_53_11]
MAGNSTSTLLADARDVRFPSFREENGELVPYEAFSVVPHAISRVFYVSDVPAGDMRGHHAHKQCSQTLVCLSGKSRIIVDDGIGRREFVLQKKSEGLYIPPGLWAEQHYLEAGTSLLVFCDRPYEPDDYIREYDRFVSWKRGGS